MALSSLVKRVEDFLASHGIKHKTASIKHPETNGQVEVSNRSLVTALKTRLLQYGGSWVDELPSALLAYRTTERTPTGETPFVLTYGTEALLPVEMMMKTSRLLSYRDDVNSQNLASEKDLVDEVCEDATRRFPSPMLSLPMISSSPFEPTSAVVRACHDA